MFNITGNTVSYMLETTSHSHRSPGDTSASWHGGFDRSGDPSATCRARCREVTAHEPPATLPPNRASPLHPPPRARSLHDGRRAGTSAVTLPLARAATVTPLQETEVVLPAPPREASTRVTAAMPQQRSPRPAAPGAASAPVRPRPHGLHGSGHGGHSSSLLEAGLRGLRMYMNTVFAGPQHSGFNVYVPMHEEAYVPVPRSPRPNTATPMSRRAESDITFDEERRRRTRVQVSGISVEVQQRVLRRLRYTPLTCRSTSSPGSPASRAPSLTTPLTASAAAPGYSVQPCEDPCESPSTASRLHNWVVALEPAASSAVPYPATSQTCSVCLRYFIEEDVAELPCGHLYHFACIMQWLQRQGSCPCCRANVGELAALRDGDEAGPR